MVSCIDDMQILLIGTQGEETQKCSFFRELCSNPERISVIYNAANDTVNLRDPNLSRTKVALANHVPASLRKEIILLMCKPWLMEYTKVNMESNLAPEEVNKFIDMDLDRRYDRTYKLIALFCKTRFGDELKGFRWMHLGRKEQQETTYLIEYILDHFLGVEDFLPLKLAPESWAISYIVSVLIRNQGKANKSPSTTMV